MLIRAHKNIGYPLSRPCCPFLNPLMAILYLNNVALRSRYTLFCGYQLTSCQMLSHFLVQQLSVEQKPMILEDKFTHYAAQSTFLQDITSIVYCKKQCKRVDIILLSLFFKTFR